MFLMSTEIYSLPLSFIHLQFLRAESSARSEFEDLRDDSANRLRSLCSSARPTLPAVAKCVCMRVSCMCDDVYTGFKEIRIKC